MELHPLMLQTDSVTPGYSQLNTKLLPASHTNAQVWASNVTPKKIQRPFISFNLSLGSFSSNTVFSDIILGFYFFKKQLTQNISFVLTKT
jgi:hypothetical protein